MKRALSLALAFVLALTLTACGKKDTGTDSDSNVPTDALTLLNTVWDSYTDDEKFPAAGGDYEHSVDGAASLSHMMNANTFTCGALRAANADEVEGLAQDMRDAIHSKQWMCGFPDKLVVFTYDRYVVALYGNEDLVNTFRDKLTAAYGNAVVAYDEAII